MVKRIPHAKPCSHHIASGDRGERRNFQQEVEKEEEKTDCIQKLVFCSEIGSLHTSQHKTHFIQTDREHSKHRQYLPSQTIFKLQHMQQQQHPLQRVIPD